MNCMPPIAPVLARRDFRLLATLVDWLIVWAPLLVGSFFGLGYLMDAEDANPNDGRLFFLGVLCFAAAMLYQLYGMVDVGQSLGKRMMRIKVVRMDGSPVELIDIVFWRNWPSVSCVIVMACFFVSEAWTFAVIAMVAILLIAPLWFLIDTLFVFTAKHRCLHDYIAGTQVIALSAYSGSIKAAGSSVPAHKSRRRFTGNEP